MMTIQKVPSEMLNHVFSFHFALEAACLIPIVCKLWQQFSYSALNKLLFRILGLSKYRNEPMISGHIHRSGIGSNSLRQLKLLWKSKKIKNELWKPLRYHFDSSLDRKVNRPMILIWEFGTLNQPLPQDAFIPF